MGAKASELSRQPGQIVRGRIAQFERQQAAFNAKLNGMDQKFQAMDDIINGTSEYYDAATGTRYKLSSSGSRGATSGSLSATTATYGSTGSISADGRRRS